jgi:hypothetical protein
MTDRAFRWAFGAVMVAFMIAGVSPIGMAQRQLEPLRTKTWADAVEACEALGGVAVPRATKVLGRSADLPACVPQLCD